MCNNYRPSSREDLESFYGVTTDKPYPAETWPDYMAPIIRRAERERDCVVANFGMMPKKRIPQGVRAWDSTNARSETVGEKRTFSGAWKALQLCLVPAQCFYEPYYAPGATKSVRHKIWVKDSPTLAIAGLWRGWPDGEFSFTMLTVNSDGHPLMRKFHKPGKEKRSVVILPPAQWDDWLQCSSTDEARSFLNLYPAELMDSEPSPPHRS